MNEQEFAQLAEEHAGFVYNVAYRMMGNQHDAEEVAQEAWIRMYGLENPEELDNARAFLFQTASNLSIDRIRRRNLEAKHNNPSDETAHSVEEQIASQQVLDLLNVALMELPVKVRQAFVLHRLKGLSYAQIASQLDVSTSMVEKYIIQTLKHFRNKLEQNNTEV